MTEGGGNTVLGYAVALVAVVLATIAVVALIASVSDSGADGDSGEPESVEHVDVEEKPDVLPEGGLFKIPADVDSVTAGAKAAGCELRTFRVKSRDHVKEGDPRVRYSSSPPTSGDHNPIPAGDGAYSKAPDVEQLVHTLEHSRVILWFERDLPARARGSLFAYYKHDSELAVLVPDPTGMEYEVAATAWTRKPGKHGTGRLLGCPEYSSDVYTALEAFKAAYRGRGMELVP